MRRHLRGESVDSAKTKVTLNYVSFLSGIHVVDLVTFQVEKNGSSVSAVAKEESEAAGNSFWAPTST